jgi:predicted nuclease of predicted toxin-antitoxin system
MRFLADEGVDRSIVEILRKFDFDVHYVIDEIRSLTDDELLHIANTESRILITRDKDFGELVYRLNQPHAGIILIRLEGYSTIQRAEIVGNIIQKHANEFTDAFTVIQPKVIRIRKRQ